MASVGVSSVNICVFCLTVFVSLRAVKTQWVIDDTGCRTPDKGVGECIPIKECKSIVDILQRAPKPFSQALIYKLKQYNCGYEGSSVKVCCTQRVRPLEIFIGGGSSGGGGSNSGATDPPDVSSHRNYNLLPKSCGNFDDTNRIYNGVKANLFEFPWMALLSYSTPNGQKFKCGGTIINENYILTAAHCVTNLKQTTRLIGVRVGEYNIDTAQDCVKQDDGKLSCSPPFQDLRIEKIIPHENYNATAWLNDIALLRVSRMEIGRENILPVCLPLGKARNYAFTQSKKVIVTGWGATETGENYSPVLLKVELPIIPLDECQNLYSKSATVSHKQLCAGGHAKDSCPGDSGGPLHTADFIHDDVRYVQHGIVSFGPRFCGVTKLPGVYTRTAFYMDWILNNMRP